MEEVLFSPVVQWAVGVIGSILSALAMWAAKNLAEKLGVSRDAEILESIEDFVDRGIAWAEKRAIKEAGDASVSLGNETANQVANEVISKFPKWMDRLGYDADDITKMVESKL